MSGRVEHYRVLERIGVGGMGESYAAYDEKLDRTVVLKFIDPERLPDGEARRTFVREARSAVALSHPSLCRVYDVFENDRQPVIVMEHVRGRTVLERTAAGPFEPREVVWLGREIARALAAAHAHGFIYRDLSASMVVVTDDGHAKLRDVGLAHLFEMARESAAAEAPNIDVHSRAMLIGAPVFMAPELLNGDRATHKSDLYAAGVVLYLMTTGRLPFSERLTAASLTEMLIHPPVPPGLFVSGVPASLERAIMRLLEKKPEARFPSAESLAASL